MTMPAPGDEPSVSLAPAQTGLTGSRTDYADPLYVLMAAVGIILLIACANAGLMLARSASRRKEMAVRLALGAGRSRIVRQLLTESVTLSVLGGALGIFFAYWGARTIVSFVSSNQTRPLGFAMGVDLRMLAFTAAISLFTGILFGIAPAFRGARVDFTPALKDASGISPSIARDRGRWFSAGNVLVVAQVALAMVVLVGAGLLVRTLQNLRSIDDRLLFQERLIARLSTFFGLLALVLACIGLYGLLSHEVSRRTREIGIRMALGAQAGDVLRLVVNQGLALAIIGVAVGTGVALAATRYLTSMLYNVRANDPLTIAAVAALLALVAFAACYIPARRATRVDPMIALRYE